MAGALQGSLKLQVSVNASTGIFEWQRRNFSLEPAARTIEAVDDEGSPVSVQLRRVKYAKEWAITSSIAGFGFDLVYDDGNMISFLANDEDTCATWVSNINACIAGMAFDDAGDDGSDENSSSSNSSSGEESSDSQGGDEGARESGGESGDREMTPDAAAGAAAMAVAGGRPPLHSTRPSSSPLHPSHQAHQSQQSRSGLSDSHNDTTLTQQQSPAHTHTQEQQMSHTAHLYERSPSAPSPSPMPPLPEPTAGGGHRHDKKQHKDGASQGGNIFHSPSAASNLTSSVASGHGSGLGLGMMGGVPLMKYSHSSSNSSIASSPSLFRPPSQAHSLPGSLASINMMEMEGQGMGMPGAGIFGGSRSLLDDEDRHSHHHSMASTKASMRRDGGVLRASADGRSGPGPEEDPSGSRDANLELQAQRWRAAADREAAEALIAKEQLSRVSAELEARMRQHAMELAQLSAVQQRNLEERDKQLEMSVLRASNEHAQFHDTALRMEREQASRELTCLRDELAAERKRYAALLQNESTLRDRAEAKEVTLAVELAGMREQLQRATAEAMRNADVLAAERAAWEREKKIVQADTNATRARLDSTQQDWQAKAQADLRTRQAELQLQFDTKIKELESSIRMTAQHEAEGQRLREAAEIQKKHEKELEAMRVEERKARAREVEQVRATYKEREKQTADDLSQLEALHSERVRRLDAQNESLRRRVADAESKAKKAVGQAGKTGDEAHKQAAQHLKHAEANARRAQQLAEDLQVAQREVQESRVREATYRSQITKTLEEARVQRAEYLETRKQLSELHVSSQQWQRAAREAGTTHSTSTTNLTILRDEVAMLEHENRRLRNENAVIQDSLRRADTLVYGRTGSGGGPCAAHNLDESHWVPAAVAGSQLPSTGVRGRAGVRSRSVPVATRKAAKPSASASIYPRPGTGGSRPTGTATRVTADNYVGHGEYSYTGHYGAAAWGLAPSSNASGSVNGNASGGVRKKKKVAKTKSPPAWGGNLPSR